MKKIITVLAVLAVSVPVCFAQKPVAKATTPVKEVPSVIKVVTAVVDSVTPADPAKNIKAALTVVGEKESKTVFTVSEKTVLVGSDKKPVTLDKLVKGGKVTVKYTAKGGINEAVLVEAVK